LAGTRVAPDEKHDSDPQASNWPGIWSYAGIGMELAGAIIGLTLAGYWVDYKFGTEPTGLIVGATLGIIGGFYNFIRQAIQLTRRQQRTDSRRDTKRKGDSAGNHDDTDR